MKYSIFFLITVFLIGCRKEHKENYDLVIKNVNLIDGTGHPMQNGVTVCIRNGEIVKIEKKSESGGQEIIDGTNKFLMPGLFDCHVHTSDYKTDFPNFIHYGVTSVLIPGGSLCTNDYYTSMRLMGNQDSIPAPKVFHTSQHFSMEGRHPSKTYASSNWRDGLSIFYLKDTIQIAQLINQVAKYPICGIKLTIEDGPAPPFVDRIPQEFVDKVVEEATKNGLEVFAHVSDNIELEMAVKGGVKNLLHYTGVNIDPENSHHKDLIKQLRDRNASWVTTLMIDKSFLYPLHPEWFETKELLDEYQKVKLVITPELVENASIYVKILMEEYGLEQSDLASFMAPQAKDIQYLHKNGINMVLGTDTGNDFNFAGYSVHEEMQLLQMGGISSLEIIKMATLNAAKMLNVEESLGSIEVGKTANMILLENNPLEDIKNSLSIHTILKNGKVQKRKTK